MSGFTDTLGTGGGGGGFPVNAPAILVPREFSKNADQNVPGFATDNTGGYGNSEHNGAPEGAYTPENPVTLTDSMRNLLVLGTEDSNGTRSLQERMIQAGYLNPDPKRGNFAPGSVASGDSTYNAYAKLVNDAIVTGKSIDDILQRRIADPKNTTGQRYWKLYQSVTGASAYTTNYTSSNVNLSTPGDAYDVAQNEYQKYLGRDANHQDVVALHAALNAFEKANPTVSSHTVTHDPLAGTFDRGGTTAGGVSPADRGALADEQIAKNDGKELGQVQTDRLVNVFEQMLGGGH